MNKKILLIFIIFIVGHITLIITNKNKINVDWNVLNTNLEKKISPVFTKELENGTIEIIGKDDNNETILYLFDAQKEKIIATQIINNANLTLTPKDKLEISLDEEKQLILEPQINHTIGYIYNIKTTEKTLVKNKINKTWTKGEEPQTLKLKNGNVLILGIKAFSKEKEEINNKYRNKHKRDSVYSSYIYKKDENKFYKIKSPPIAVTNTTPIELKNGNILLAGGYYKKQLLRYGEKTNKIQILKILE